MENKNNPFLVFKKHTKWNHMEPKEGHIDRFSYKLDFIKKVAKNNNEI